MGAEYSDAKRKLLEKYLRGEVGARAETQRIGSRPEGERIPLSHAQEQVWVHAQMAPEVPLYNEPVTIHYSGLLNVAALERAFNEILRRHEAWRTCFVVVNGQPFQEVTEQLSISLPVIDLRTIPEQQRDAAAVAIATADARIPIDLGKTPLFRTRLIRMADEELRLYLTLSHIIFDGVAIYRVFLPELAALYKAYSAGQPSPLPELAIQYPDYAAWERRTYTREALAKDIEYWRDKLSGPMPDVYLATDRPHPRSQTFRGSMYPFRLNGKLTTDLRNFCRREGVSLFHALLAGFAALLYRHSGEERIPLGSVTAGRNRPETTALLGYFLNTVVVPADFSGDPSFLTLVQRARNWTIDALDHDRVPFDYLVRELKIARDPSRNPLFQALFSLEPPMPEVDPAWRLTQMDVDTGATKYDLYLELDERTDEVLARFHYSTDLFDRDTMVRMAADWQRLLEYGATHADARVSELPILSEEDKRRITVEWNRTEQSYPSACIHQLFESQAARSPGVVAVATAGLQMTYRELNERANQLAHYLIRQGVGPEVPVGLCLNRGAEMVVALLAVLKAGGAYVPLDPRLPDERLATMLADVKPKTIITDRSQHREVFGASVIHIDSDWNLISSESNENPNRVMRPGSLAYVMYTSGSTGRPKGVAVEHRSVVNLLHSMQCEPGLSAQDVLLAVTTLSFDIAGLEIFLPLITGARLFVASDADIVDGIRLGELLLENGATLMQATPTTWRLLIAAGWPGAANLTILCGGEELTPDLAQQLARRGNSVWNVYGPTETTIWSSIYRVCGNEENTVPIGRPLANTSIYILDPHLKHVPVNVTGEIYIGGDGVARGYLNRPELTAEHFVAINVETGKSERLYRTGDLGRFRANGNVEYLGRLDNQIKLRGQRIELGEIESVLASHPAVGQAVVTLSGAAADQQKLSAYVVAKAGVSSPAAGELRRYLRTKLPEHMVPTSFSEIDAVPQLPSGKVNRAALASLGSAPLLDREELVPPRNAMETKLAEIWRELLEVKQVGIEQNFFELGGHSLLALQVTARIRRMFAVELPVRSVFEAPTIAGLAGEVQQAQALGLKVRTKIPQHSAPTAAAAAAQEELLTQLDKLPAQEVRSLLKDLLDGKNYEFRS
jgi:surfactin family lipopeptide synthetase A